MWRKRIKKRKLRSKQISSCILAGSQALPGSRGFEQLCPAIGVEEFCAKLGRKIGVLKARRVVFLHKLNILCQRHRTPPVPEPLTILSEARDREDPPVNENSDLCIVEPRGYGSGVQAGPVFLVARCGSSSRNKDDGEKNCRSNTKWRSHFQETRLWAG